MGRDALGQVWGSGRLRRHWGCCGVFLALSGDSCVLFGVRSGCALETSQRPGAGSWGRRGSDLENALGREVLE